MIEPETLIPAEAIEAVRAAAFRVQSDDPDDPQLIRTVVHSFRGGIGADWDLGAVIQTIVSARALLWQPVGPLATTHPLLVIETDGGKIRFEAKR